MARLHEYQGKSILLLTASRFRVAATSNADKAVAAAKEWAAKCVKIQAWTHRRAALEA